MIFAEETFWDLMRSGPHWAFELFLMVLFDGLIGAILYPLFKRWLKAHDERKHAHEHCNDVHQEKLF